MIGMTVPGQALTGRRALVCGASAGIGRATALALAAAGAEVTAVARSTAGLQSLVDEIRSQNGTADWLQGDLEEREHLCDEVSALIATTGPIHILINNTGGVPSGPILEANEADFLRPFGRHVLASQLLTQLLLPGMKEEGYGRILNIVSTSVREPIPGLGVSNTIRGAMAGWSKSLSRELPPGVTINNVLPGFTKTDRLNDLGQAIAGREGSTPEAVLSRWLTEVPEGRLAQPAEIAATVAFLASPSGAFVRGASIPVDGGRMRSI